MLISGLLNGFIPAKNSTDGQELVGEDEFWLLFWKTSTSLVAISRPSRGKSQRCPKNPFWPQLASRGPRHLSRDYDFKLD